MFKSYALLIVSLLISPVEAKQYGPIESGEMLWNIAAQVYADPSVSRHQVMLALLKANPQAFRVPCNMNSLKVNALLTLPELATLQAITPQQAL
ncbi:MAG: FimV/HubP family polar landmark protein, partial [Pseudomonadota bacterium]|nr:FimV/HubP family polar landmark protein [Pseudomonadota bacterium]